jgi:hypothetical protein
MLSLSRKTKIKLVMTSLAAASAAGAWFIYKTPSGVTLGLSLSIHKLHPVSTCYVEGVGLEPWEARDVARMYKIVETGKKNHRVLAIDCSLKNAGKDSLNTECFKAVPHWTPFLGHTEVRCPDKNGVVSPEQGVPAVVEPLPSPSEQEPLVE